MVLLAWWSAPEVKLATECQQQNEQLHFIQMLQDLLIQSNSKMLKVIRRLSFICHGFIHSRGLKIIDGKIPDTTRHGTYICREEPT